MILRAERVSWGFKDGDTTRQIFDGLDLSFVGGVSYAVTGPSGCGKTTLLSILSLFCRPISGRILFAGGDLSRLSDSEAQAFRRGHVGLVFQTFRLFEYLSLAEHVRFVAGVRGRSGCAAAGFELLERFGLVAAEGRLPRELSGGEKQRAALALALMTRPSIVLADEPTAALDAANAQIVTDVLTSYAVETDAIVIAVSHDRRLIGSCIEEVPLHAE